MVLCFATLEFFGALCMALVVIYKQIENFVPIDGEWNRQPHSLSDGWLNDRCNACINGAINTSMIQSGQGYDLCRSSGIVFNAAVSGTCYDCCSASAVCTVAAAFVTLLVLGRCKFFRSNGSDRGSNSY